MQLYAFVIVMVFFSSTLDCQIKVKGEIIPENSTDKFNIKLTVEGGTAPYSYYWFTEKSQNSVVQRKKDQLELNEGNYTVVVEDSEGCHTTKRFTVKAE